MGDFLALPLSLSLYPLAPSQPRGRGPYHLPMTRPIAPTNQHGLFVNGLERVEDSLITCLDALRQMTAIMG